MADQVDEVQYAAGEGPCLQALSDGTVIHIDDLGTEESAGGTTACTHLPQASARRCRCRCPGQRQRPFGALNIYSRESAAFSAEDREQANRFAAFAAGAISVARRMADQAALSTQLQEALNSPQRDRPGSA